jgi:hypothetical protein
MGARRMSIATSKGWACSGDDSTASRGNAADWREPHVLFDSVNDLRVARRTAARCASGAESVLSRPEPLRFIGLRDNKPARDVRRE